MEELQSHDLPHFLRTESDTYCVLPEEDDSFDVL